MTHSPPLRPWTVPNAISVARLAALPVFAWLLFGAKDHWAAAVLLGALGATDWVDGFIARRFNQVSELGKVLDPTADRLLLVVALVGMFIDGSLPWLVAAALAAREAAVGGAALVLAAMGGRKMDVTFVGKTGTLLMMFALPFFLAGHSRIGAADVFLALGWATSIIGLPIHYFSAVRYVPLARQAVREGRAARASPPGGAGSLSADEGSS